MASATPTDTAERKRSQQTLAWARTVFCRSIDRLFPRYSCCEISSRETTRASEPGRFSSNCFARSMDIRPAEQPIPPREYERQSARKPKRRITDAASDGVGQNSEQFTTRKSISRGFVPVDASTLSTTENMVSSATERAADENRGREWAVAFGLRVAVGVSELICNEMWPSIPRPQ